MSWQAYIDSSGHLDKAAILSGLPEEGKALAKTLGGDTNAAYAEGFHIGTERYGKEGAVVVKTKQAIVIGHYGEQHVAGNAANVVERLADYLIGLGY
ncbi:unnamed protein product [Parascedosporium putredinis]|uniref:Profilin n=1 Tax=Parascedosporium putredinis TaxID=1442378 RepID=A0A9P1GUM8_9PEZI|nr:unnamed protein product [Parascedosporium putredinis]CAI7987651.1 unnamed protein product [Parascedosporium putredinis]